MDQNEQPTIDFTELTAHVVSSYVAHNAVHRADLPTMIASVYGALQGLGTPGKLAEPAKQQPAVSIKKSVTPDFLISLEDGKPYKSSQTAPDEARNDAGRLSGKMGIAPRLPNGGSQLRQETLRTRQEHRPGKHAQAGGGGCERGWTCESSQVQAPYVAKRKANP